MKICKGCHLEKPLNQFYSHNCTKDGKRGKCIVCWKIENKKTPDQNKAYRAANIERLRLFDRSRRKDADSIQAKAEYDRLYRNRPRIKKTLKEKMLFTKFRITVAQYNEMLRRQNFVCAICNNFEKSKSCNGGLKSLGVDHNHKTGKIRGLLCDSCNRGIGLLRDNPITLLKAVRYLKIDGIHGR